MVMSKLRVLKAAVNQVVLRVDLGGQKGARIYRGRRESGPYEEVGVAFEETYVDAADLEPGKTYYYRSVDWGAPSLYPEAGDRLEAESLAAMARAASPAAIDLLAHQPSLWRMALRRHSAGGGHDPDHAGAGSLTDRHRVQILGRSEVLDRLIDPSLVVVVGQPNVGKSTLTNQMLGRSVSIVADLPGTTRDWVAGLAEISGSSSIDAPQSQVAVGVDAC